MKRLFPFVVFILLILGGVFYIPYRMRPESHRAEITALVGKFFKRPVVIGPMSMSYLPPTLHLQQLEVIKEDGDPLLQIDSASAPLSWMALFHGQISPSEIQIQHGVLHAYRRIDGSWDTSDWLGVSGGFSGTSAKTISMISWKDCEVHWIDRQTTSPQELILGQMNGSWDISRSVIASKGALSGVVSPVIWVSIGINGKFLSDPQWSGTFVFKDDKNGCTLAVEDKSGVLDVKGGAGNWRLHPIIALAKFYGRGTTYTGGESNKLSLDNWQIHLSGDHHRMNFDSTAGIAQGLAEIKGNLQPSPAGIRAHLDAAIKNVPVEVVLDMLGEPIALDGQATALASDFELLLSSHTAGTLMGNGYIELQNGHYKLPDAAIQKLSKAKTMAYLKSKFPDFPLTGIPVAKVSAHWKAKNGMVDIDDGYFVCKDMKAAWVGKFDILREGLDGFLRLQIHEKDPQFSSLIPVHYRSQPANGRLQGTWQEWSLRSLSSSKIPAATQAKLRKAINQ